MLTSLKFPGCFTHDVAFYGAGGSGKETHKPPSTRSAQTATEPNAVGNFLPRVCFNPSEPLVQNEPLRGGFVRNARSRYAASEDFGDDRKGERAAQERRRKPSLHKERKRQLL